MTKREYKKIRKLLTQCKRNQMPYWVGDLESLQVWRNSYIQAKSYSDEEREYLGSVEHRKKMYESEKPYHIIGPRGFLP